LAADSPLKLNLSLGSGRGCVAQGLIDNRLLVSIAWRNKRSRETGDIE